MMPAGPAQREIKTNFDGISKHNVEFALLWSSLHTLCVLSAPEKRRERVASNLCDFCRHPGVELDRDELLGLFQDPHGQITGTGTNFENSVGRFQFGFLQRFVQYS